MSNDYRCCLEVDLEKIHANGCNVKRYIGNTRLMAVLKGNAYGLGISDRYWINKNWIEQKKNGCE